VNTKIKLTTSCIQSHRVSTERRRAGLEPEETREGKDRIKHGTKQTRKKAITDFRKQKKSGFVSLCGKTRNQARAGVHEGERAKGLHDDSYGQRVSEGRGGETQGPSR